MLRAVSERDAYANLALPGAAARARNHRPRRGVRHRADLRHLPRPGPARRRHRARRRSAARQASTRCCWTCCGWAPTSCCAPGSSRTPRCPPPSSRPASNSTRREPVSSTACCAPSPGATKQSWVDELAPPDGHRPGRPPGVRARPSAMDRAGVRRRARRRRGRAATRCWPATTPARRFIWPPGPACMTAAELAEQVDGTVGRYSPYAVYLAGGDPGGSRRCGTAMALVQDEGSQLVARALTLAPAGRSRRRALARPVRRARRQDRAAGRDRSLRSRGARVTAVEPTPRRADLVEQNTRGPARRRAARRRPRHRARARLRPGAGRRAVHRARRAAPPARGALAPPAQRRAAAGQAAARAAGLGDPVDPTGRRGALRDVFAASRRDGRGGRRRPAPPAGHSAGRPAAVRRRSTTSATGPTCSCGRTGTAPTRCSPPLCKYADVHACRAGNRFSPADRAVDSGRRLRPAGRRGRGRAPAPTGCTST